MFQILTITIFCGLDLCSFSSNYQSYFYGAYSEEIDKKDQNTAALIEKGDDFYNSEQYDEAIKYYNKVLEINQSDTYALSSKADAFYNLGQYDEGQYNNAIEYYDKVLVINENDTYGLNGKAASLYSLGRYNDAVKYYGMALAINQSDTYALTGVGDSLYALEKYQDAMKEYDEVLKIDPGDARAIEGKQDITNQIGRAEGDVTEQDNNGYVQLSQDEWLIDPLSIYIKIDSSINNATNYLNIALESIDIWSQLLKQKSTNYAAWNFNILNSIDRSNFDEISEPIDVVIELTRSNLGDGCDNYLGITYPFPLDKSEPDYSKVFVSCYDNLAENFLSSEEVYSIILHEFGHVLGLDHTFEREGDLMCPIAYEESMDEYADCNWSEGKNEPSDLDLDALLYKYGFDGFTAPNRMVKEDSKFDFNIQFTAMPN